MTWNAFESENEIVFASCVSAVLHLVINGSRRASKTHDNNGMTQKSENLFYATNPLVPVTLFGNCVSYLWQTKMRNKKWKRNERKSNVDFRRLSKRHRKIISYPFQMKLTFFVLFHFVTRFGNTFSCLILIHFLNSFNLKKYLIVIFQYFAQFKELFLMWMKIIIGIWNFSLQFSFVFSQFTFTVCSPRSKWLFYRDKVLDFVFVFVFVVYFPFKIRLKPFSIIIIITVSNVVLLTHWNECYSNHLMTIIITFK